MYQSKKIMSVLSLKYEKIDVCLDNCMLFWKEHANEKKCLECGQSRFIYVVTQDGEKVTTKVTQKQLHYFPITPRLKRLFISKRTVRRMRWHKEGICENDGVMGHHSRCSTGLMQILPVMQEIFASGWQQMALSHSVQTPHHSCWPVFAMPYNLPPSLCMKFEFIFLCLIIPSPEAPSPRINVLLKALIEELK
jgi:hypothetical protein